jgi:hypothetical protein
MYDNAEPNHESSWFGSTMRSGATVVVSVLGCDSALVDTGLLALKFTSSG